MNPSSLLESIGIHEIKNPFIKTHVSLENPLASINHHPSKKHPEGTPWKFCKQKPGEAAACDLAAGSGSGIPNSWMVSFMENAKMKWIMTGGSPI